MKQQQFELQYQIELVNGNNINGKIITYLGQQIIEIKRKIIQFEGFKNQHTFKLINNNITIQSQFNNFIKIIKFKEQKEKLFGSLVSVRSRKMSDESMFEEQSIVFQDNLIDNFIEQEPEVPPLVCGYVTFPNSLFFCFSSKKYLSLDSQSAKFYQKKQNNHPFKQVIIDRIHEIKSYKRKQYFCIRLILKNEMIQMKFINKDVCKQWMGYFNQALKFTYYLKERKQFSKSQSFQKYVETILNYKENLSSTNNISSTKIVNLSDEKDTIIHSVHTNIPCESSFKKAHSKIMKLSSFQITHKVDSGSFSTIYLAYKNNKQMALKQMNKGKLLYKGQMKYAITEINCLIKSKSCPFIIPLYYAFQTHEYLYLALKYIPYGNLSRLIQKRKRIPQDQAIILIAELVVAIQFLHEQKILYRDLKPENILLDENGHLYLTDFGLAKQLDHENQQAHSFLGTPLYLAPQRFLGDASGIDYKSDIYAVGMIFFQMIHGYHPFSADNFNSVVYNIKHSEVQIDDEISPAAKDFLYCTLEKNQEKRIEKMSRHELFQKIDWKKLKQKMYKGAIIEKSKSESIVQINYQIDEDYNESNYPDKKIIKWNYNYENELKNQ